VGPWDAKQTREEHGFQDRQASPAISRTTSATKAARRGGPFRSLCSVRRVVDLPCSATPDASRLTWVPKDMSALDSVACTASYAGGQILRAATGMIAARPAAKPLHPRGSVVHGTLHRSGSEDRTGARWLDQSGDDQVLVRHSRATGLPSPIPDIYGLAIRVPTDGGRRGDLLFASTGLGRLTRFTLTPATSPHRRPMTTLLPYRTPAGALLLSAVFQADSKVELAWAIRSGAWNTFAELSLDDDPADAGDLLVSFDPVRNVLPGLETYEWVRRLREPAYATARRSRRSWMTDQAPRGQDHLP
jgi:hypothetical protein